MRNSLHSLLSKAIILEYTLPNTINSINCSVHTTDEDTCMKVGTIDSDIAKVIYNGIVEYSFDEWEVDIHRLDIMQRRALKTKIRYNDDAGDDTKIKYGFYGEILLYLILQHFYHAETLTARGRFCNILEKSETKGYDTYQLKYNSIKGVVELWFGEVKFYQKYKDAVDKVFDNINKALSDKYFESNVIAIFDKADDTHLPEQIKEIKCSWEDNPDLNIIQEVVSRNMILVYPIVIIFDQRKTYDVIIQEVITYINTKVLKPSLSIRYKLFFILLPVSNGKLIKEQVITWISKREPQI